MTVALATALWLLALFAIAWWGDRSPRWSARQSHWIYALALGVYFTSWTFYGTVTQVAQWRVWLAPTLLGVALLFALGLPLIKRISEQAQRHASTSLADLIAAHCDRSPALARLLTAVLVVGSVPYIALQLKAISSSLVMLVPSELAGESWSQALVAVMLLSFALSFGARRAAVDGSHRGLMLAMAGLSIFKLLVLLAIALVVWLHGPSGALLGQLRHTPIASSEGQYLSLVALGACAFISLPHVFHVLMAELKQSAQLKPVALIFLGYLILIAVPILPLALLGQAMLPAQVSGDLYTLALPQQLGLHGLSVLGFLGGLSAATGMVVVSAHALGIMLAQHWFASGLLRSALSDVPIGEGSQMQAKLLRQRRAAIVLVFVLAYGFAEWTAGERSLADIGVLSMGTLAQLMPALVCVAYAWPLRASTAGAAVIAGLTALWLLQGMWQNTALAVIASLAVNGALLLLGARQAARSPGNASPTVGTLERIAQRFLSQEQRTSWRQLSHDPEQLRHALELRLAPLIGASGAHVLLTRAQTSAVGTFEAVADLVDATSQEIQFNQRLLHTALENMSQGISVVDAQLRLVAWNTSYARLFDFPEALLQIGVPIKNLIRFNIERGLLGASAGPDDLAARLQRRLDLMQLGQPYVAERELADGSVLQIRGNPMPGGGFVATFTDVTAFRHAEQALKLSNETLEQRVDMRTEELTAAMQQVAQAAQAKSRFLTALSHDLLQPVNAAQLYARALAHELGASEAALGALAAEPQTQASDTLKHLEGALHSAAELLQSLLDMARLDADRLKVEPRSVEVDAMLGQLVRDCIPLAEARGLQLRFRRSGLHVQSDPQLLRRILQNFLTNALRYTLQGGVLITAQRRSTHVWLRVFDTGPGIAEADQASIFEAFQRLPAQQGNGDGLGLGLTIAQRMAELLGHPLQLHSLPGRGSVFSVSAPRAQAAPVARVLAPVYDNWTGLDAWVVDNHGPSLDALSRLLQSWKVRIRATSSYSEALAAPVLDASVWLLDFHLEAGHTGLELYLALKAQGPARPCVIISADGSEQVRSAVQSAGLHLLLKPTRPLALRSLLSELLRKA